MALEEEQETLKRMRVRLTKEHLRKRFPERTPPKLSLIQKIGHFLLVVLGWITFIWMWSLVVSRPQDNSMIVLLVVGSFIISPVITFLWVFHNMGIYKRKGPRVGSKEIPHAYEHDWAGRKITADWEELKRARVVVIEIDEFGKNYVAASINRDKL
jgi:hypothetical protein